MNLDPIAMALGIFLNGNGVRTGRNGRTGENPDAFAFAVLLTNMAVPLIDQLTQPKVYGHNAQKVANSVTNTKGGEQ